jgi:Uma2 family endonuclease
MTRTIPIPARPEINYPDSDGKPMSGHTLQYKWIVVIKEGLEVHFDDDPNVFVAGDLLWYPVEGTNKIRQGPDVLVAFGRPKGERGSYKQWVEGGIAPQVVFEVLSPGNRPGEMEGKLQFYQQYGVEEYYIYDPHNGSLEGWRRRGHQLKKIRRMKGFRSPRLGIQFEPAPGEDNLTVIGRDGEPFITPLQMSRRFKEAEQRAKAEAEQRVKAEQRAEAERLRAEEAERLRAEEAQQRARAEQRAEEAERQRAAERERNDRYTAKLRELGIEPE